MDIINTYKKSISSPQATIIKPIKINWSTESRLIQQLALQNEPGFRFTEQNKPIYKLLLQYFTGNPDFEKQPLPGSEVKGSLNKGILLIGPVGSGKTFAMSTVFKIYTSKYLRSNSYQIYKYSNMKHEYGLNGLEALSEFGQIASSSGGIQRNDTKVVLVDDFLSNGTFVSYFGNKIEFADELIDSRYEAFRQSRKLTHFTTNTYADKMKEVLDERSISRLLEMCNIIEFVDKDWRRL